MCSTVGIEIVLVIAALKKWITEADVKEEILKTGPAHRVVYFRPPRRNN